MKDWKNSTRSFSQFSPKHSYQVYKKVAASLTNRRLFYAVVSIINLRYSPQKNVFLFPLTLQKTKVFKYFRPCFYRTRKNFTDFFLCCSLLILRRGDREAEGARLEIVCTARYRGFESLPLRHLIESMSFKGFEAERALPVADKRTGRPQQRTEVSQRRSRYDAGDKVGESLPLRHVFFIGYNRFLCQ
jgi:hypothetical protein